jgi:HK97 family phage prohead protease
MKTKDSTLALTLKAGAGEGDARTFEGYASVFGVVDSYRDVVEPGAFVESLARQKREGGWPLMLWAHDVREPIGLWEDLAEDAKGLWGKGRLLEGVQKADEAYIRLKAGAVRGLSIGYAELEAEPDKERNVRRLKKLDLFEVSIVAFPANRRAHVDEVRADPAAEELGRKLLDLGRRIRDGEPPAIREFEGLLREATVPKSMAVAIASRGYATAIRGEPGGDEASKSLADAIARLGSIEIPSLRIGE